ATATLSRHHVNGCRILTFSACRTGFDLESIRNEGGEAAHLPVNWATEVLKSLAKKGQPSRAEITDAAMGERAECVMLNKGPHIVAEVSALDNILRRMQGHQSKKSPRLRKLHLNAKRETEAA